MSAITFDTIKYFDELITAGVPKPQAKAQTNALKHAVITISDGELVSKVDLLAVQNVVTTDLKDLELKIEKRFAAIENRFVRLEVLMVIIFVVSVLPALKSLF